MPRAAAEQGRADLVFERLDLPADRRLGQEQLLRRGAEAEPAGDRLEGAQRADGERAVAELIHVFSASMKGIELIGS